MREGSCRRIHRARHFPLHQPAYRADGRAVHSAHDFRCGRRSCYSLGTAPNSRRKAHRAQSSRSQHGFSCRYPESRQWRAHAPAPHVRNRVPQVPGHLQYYVLSSGCLREAASAAQSPLPAARHRDPARESHPPPHRRERKGTLLIAGVLRCRQSY